MSGKQPEGADVAIGYLESELQDAAETVRLIEEAGRRSLTCPDDLTQEDQCRRLIDTVVAEFGGIDILVTTPRTRWSSRAASRTSPPSSSTGC